MLLAAALCQADPSTQLVTNGGFETGDFSGWTLSGSITPCLFVGTVNDARCIPTTVFGPNSGAYAAELGNAGADASLSQTITTTGTGTYDVSFWLASQSYGTPDNDFSVTWGGVTLTSAANLGSFGYTKFDFAGLTAAGPTTTLTFTFHNTPSYFALDDVSVVDPVPEPAPFAVWGLLLALPLYCALRRHSPQDAPARITATGSVRSSR